MKILELQNMTNDVVLIRTGVFVEEQHFCDEFDDIDSYATHLVAYENETPIAVARVFYDEKEQRYKVGRFAVRKPYRGKGIGLEMVKKACEVAKEMGATEVYLHSQVQAIPFYEEVGFSAFGEVGYEEYCPHIWMKKQLQ